MSFSYRKYFAVIKSIYNAFHLVVNFFAADPDLASRVSTFKIRYRFKEKFAISLKNAWLGEKDVTKVIRVQKINSFLFEILRTHIVCKKCTAFTKFCKLDKGTIFALPSTGVILMSNGSHFLRTKSELKRKPNSCLEYNTLPFASLNKSPSIMAMALWEVYTLYTIIHTVM